MNVFNTQPATPQKPLAKYLAFLGIAMLLASAHLVNAQSPSDPKSLLAESFDLSGKRASSPQFFVMTSKLIVHTPDGKRVGTDIYRLRLKCNPVQPGEDGEEYVCARFTFQPDGGAEMDIPALANWKYVFKPSGDKKDQIFGIDRAKFDGIADSAGKALRPDKAFHVYNAFIDFHSFCNVFAERTKAGRGIQDLDRIGDNIVHASAFTEPSVGPASFFKNGEVTLEFKGLSRINGKSCALIGYDSGESSFKVATTTGSSHYFGDIYKDLAGGWVQKATMTEIVVSETTVPGPPHKVNAVIERLIEIRNVRQKEFGS
jgi:hypothetical protein